LTHANGDEFTLPSYNRNKDFFLFHIKGSAFIEKFLNLKYIEPLFASHRELRRYEELYENLLSTIIPAYNELNPADYKVKNFFELLHQIRRLGKAIVEQRASSDADFADKIRRLLAQILLIRRTLPDDIFSIEFNESHRHQLAHLLSAPMAPGFHQYERELLANHALLSAFYIASFFIEDPLFMFINRSALKPLQP
jgi:hypothetical protein